MNFQEKDFCFFFHYNWCSLHIDEIKSYLYKVYLQQSYLPLEPRNNIFFKDNFFLKRNIFQTLCVYCRVLKSSLEASMLNSAQTTGRRHSFVCEIIE